MRSTRSQNPGEQFGIDQLLPTLGPLERRTLEEVWRLGHASVREVLDVFGNEVAYTTVMTTLDRLYKKGFLERTKVDRAFIYHASLTKDQLQIGFASNVITGLIEIATGSTRPVLACIVDAVSDSDRELLDDLERLVKQKKAELEGKD